MAEMLGASIHDHIRPNDVRAFRDAAMAFKVHILVRRTNPASLQYIGRKGYIPKPVDCKPKTADFDVLLPGGLISKCAGLVVDPTMPGLEKAFREGKAAKARDEWSKFSKELGIGDAKFAAPPALYSGKAFLDGNSMKKLGERIYFSLDRGGVYLVQTDAAAAHYGCLMFCPLRILGAFPADAKRALELLQTRRTNCYIHGDYDLFGIVPVEMPAFKTVRESLLYGVRNLYSERSREIAQFLNRRMGAPMIQHGAEESSDRPTGEHEELDVFWAGGDVTEVKGRAAIEKLYRESFAGRRTGSGSSGLILR